MTERNTKTIQSQVLVSDQSTMVLLDLPSEPEKAN